MISRRESGAREELVPTIKGRRRWMLLTALTTVLLVLGAACGGDDGDGDEAAPAEPAPGVPEWCGTEEITIALSDGFGGNSWRQITRAEYEDEASQCPNVTETLYTDGQGNTQKAISDINGLVAQGVDAIIVFPDAGEAVLPAIREGYEAGVVMVPYRVEAGGEPGVDFHHFIPTDFYNDGVLWATWMAEALEGEGNVVYLGGPAANSESLAKAEAIASVLEEHPGIEIVGEQPYSVTNWDAAETQRVMTSLLARYPQIDGVMMDFGAQLIMPSFEEAGVPVPAIATQDSNGVACFWEEDPSFEYMSVSAQNWHVRRAVQFAVAEAAGGELPDSEVVENFVFDDSLNGEVECDPDLPENVHLSSQLTKEEIREAVE